MNPPSPRPAGSSQYARRGLGSTQLSPVSSRSDRECTPDAPATLQQEIDRARRALTSAQARALKYRLPQRPSKDASDTVKERFEKCVDKDRESTHQLVSQTLRGWGDVLDLLEGIDNRWEARLRDVDARLVAVQDKLKESWAMEISRARDERLAAIEHDDGGRKRRSDESDGQDPKRVKHTSSEISNSALIGAADI